MDRQDSGKAHMIVWGGHGNCINPLKKWLVVIADRKPGKRCILRYAAICGWTGRRKIDSWQKELAICSHFRCERNAWGRYSCRESNILREPGANPVRVKEMPGRFQFYLPDGGFLRPPSLAEINVRGEARPANKHYQWGQPVGTKCPSWNFHSTASR